MKSESRNPSKLFGLKCQVYGLRYIFEKFLTPEKLVLLDNSFKTGNCSIGLMNFQIFTN